MVLRRGTPGDDRLVGTLNDDQLYGLAGNDRLIGNGGDDELRDGTGNDLLFGGAGDDFFDMTADPAFQDVARGGNGNDVFSAHGLGGDQLHGEAGADWFSVQAHRGGRYDVTMTGGDGADHYLITLAETNDARVTITDYTAGQDTLDLRTAGDKFLAATISRFDRSGDGRIDPLDGDQTLDDGDSVRFVDNAGNPDIVLQLDGLTLTLLEADALF